MLAAAVLASWLAQAEPAPAETMPTTPLDARTAPIAVAPKPPTPPAPDNAVGVYAGWGHRLGTRPETIGPANGISVGGTYQRRYLTLLGNLELGAGLDFFYDKYVTDVTGSMTVAPGQEQHFPSQRVISQTSFALTQTVAWRAGARPPVRAGGRRVRGQLLLDPRAHVPPRNVRRRATARPRHRRPRRRHHADHRHLRARRLHAWSSRIPPTRPEPTSYSFLGDSLDVDLGVVLPF